MCAEVETSAVAELVVPSLAELPWPAGRVARRSPLIWALTGPAVRLCGRTRPGRGLLMLAGRVAGRALVRSRAFGMRPGGDARSVAANWIRVLVATGCGFEVGEAGPERVEVRMLVCPAGLSSRDGREACWAGMEADRQVVARLGGTLLIGETLATGASKCFLTVLPRE